MVTQAIAFVLHALFSIFILAALVRFWMQALRAPTRNPIAHFTMALTDWAVKPLRRVVPGFGMLDWSSIIVAYAFEFTLQVLLALLVGASLIDNPNVLSVLLFAAFVEMMRLSIYVFIGAVIIQAVLSWVNPYHPVAPFFAALSNPLMKPVKRVIPPVGGVDISPIFVLIFLQLLLMLPIAWLEAETAGMLSRALQ
ncbi:MAG TPA: YggT family protein [Usitatibacter sp.]